MAWMFPSKSGDSCGCYCSGALVRYVTAVYTWQSGEGRVYDDPNNPGQTYPPSYSDLDISDYIETPSRFAAYPSGFCYVYGNNLPATTWSGDSLGQLPSMEYVVYDTSLLNDTDTPTDYTGTVIEGVSSAQWFMPPLNASQDVVVTVYSSKAWLNGLSLGGTLNPGSEVIDSISASLNITNRYNGADPNTCKNHQQIIRYSVNAATGKISLR